MRKALSLILALLGLFDSLYLLWIYTSPSRPMVCLGTGCDAVRASVYSHLWGIPMPVFGVAGYWLIAALIIAESLVPAANAIDVRYALAGATAFGFLFSLYLEYLQAFVIHAFCAWCVTSGLVMTALFAFSIHNLLRPAQEPDPSAQLAQVRRYFVVGVAAVLIGVPAFQQLAAHGEPAPPPAAVSDAKSERLVRPDSHVWGNPQAQVTVVEFGDFECPVCGREEPIAREIRKKYANQIRFVFRQFPLIHSHPFSERMAQASECAARQGKFWDAVDEIYAHQDDLTNERLKRDAAEIGLDQDKFNQCLESGAGAAQVKRDREDGKALGVNATPTFFIGRQVVEGVPGFDEFSRRIDDELAANGAGSSSASVSSAAQAPPPATGAKKSVKSSAASENGRSPAATAEPASSSLGALGAAPGNAFSAFQSKGVACSENEAAKKQPELISTAQLRSLLETKAKLLFVDVRPAKNFAAGRIPGAINIPVDDMTERWSTLPKDRVIVFYESGRSSGDICASGRAAGRILLDHGYNFDDVKVYQDGLAGWESAGLNANR